MEISPLFNDYFSKIYQSRWPGLLESLLAKEKQVARVNQLIETNQSRLVSLEKQSWLENCYWIDSENSSTVFPQRQDSDLLDVYIMDPASVFAARKLMVQSGDRVLDMCAAPGGKSLILIEGLKESGEIFLNDLSPDRRDRLKKVIQNYVPRDIRDRVWITGKDAVQFGLKEENSFDKILLDAPCSGERHILENQDAMKEWTPRRSENLAIRQYSLLSSALLAVKSGGHILYSTCSISPIENDGVIAKLLKKKKDQVKVIELQPEGGAEKTIHGLQFLPDQCGFGPIYLSLVQIHK